MPQIECPCGKLSRFTEAQRGKRAKCPQCGEPLLLKESVVEDPGFEVVEDDISPKPVPVRKAPQPLASAKAPVPTDAGKPKPQAEDHDFEVIDDEEEETDKPVRKKKRRKKKNSRRFPWGTVGGAAMVIGGIAWLIAGLAAGKLFFYPIFLVLLGFYRFFISLMHSGDD